MTFINYWFSIIESQSSICFTKNLKIRHYAPLPYKIYAKISIVLMGLSTFIWKKKVIKILFMLCFGYFTLLIVPIVLNFFFSSTCNIILRSCQAMMLSPHFPIPLFLSYSQNYRSKKLWDLLFFPRGGGFSTLKCLYSISVPISFSTNNHTMEMPELTSIDPLVISGLRI